jgi:hypothetical protein
MNDYWFTTDGTYGSNDDLTVLDTTNWKGEDWLAISECSDAERLNLALAIAKKRQ